MSPVLLPRHSLFGLDPSELRATPRIFGYMLNVCKFFIWLSRNDFRFRGIQPGAVSVIESVKACVKFNLPLFFKRFKSSRSKRYFHHQWGAHGVVAPVDDGKLTLCLSFLFLCAGSPLLVYCTVARVIYVFVCPASCFARLFSFWVWVG